MAPDIRRIVAEGAAAGRSKEQIKSELVAKYGRAVLPLPERTETLAPERFKDPLISAAYGVARQMPAELAKYPCFCDCYIRNGHLSLLDCFKNEHAVACKACVDGAILVGSMVGEGRSDLQIRQAVVERFSKRR